MADDDIKIEQATLWRRDGKRYVVINTSYETKAADAANWSQAIIYQDEHAEEAPKVRTRQDFLSKFEPVV